MLWGCAAARGLTCLRAGGSCHVEPQGRPVGSGVRRHCDVVCAAGHQGQGASEPSIVAATPIVLAAAGRTGSARWAGTLQRAAALAWAQGLLCCNCVMALQALQPQDATNSRVHQAMRESRPGLTRAPVARKGAAGWAVGRQHRHKRVPASHVAAGVDHHCAALQRSAGSEPAAAGCRSGEWATRAQVARLRQLHACAPAICQAATSACTLLGSWLVRLAAAAAHRRSGHSQGRALTCRQPLGRGRQMRATSSAAAPGQPGTPAGWRQGRYYSVHVMCAYVSRSRAEKPATRAARPYVPAANRRALLCMLPTATCIASSTVQQRCLRCFQRSGRACW